MSIHYKKRRMDVRSVAVTALATALSLLWWVPLFWMVGVALSPETAKTTDFFALLRPPYTLEHIRGVFTNRNAHMLLWFGNSLLISVVSVALMLLVVTFAGFAFARLNFRFKKFWFWLIMISIMVPGEATLVSSYVLYHELNLLNTIASMIIPVIASAFSLLLMKSFIEGIPGELFETAKIDGCGYLRMVVELVIPLTKTALSSLGIFAFLGTWNNFLWPYITISDTSKMTVAVGISYFTGQGTSAINAGMAASLVASLPVIVVFFIFQRQITKGIAFTGLKG